MKYDNEIKNYVVLQNNSPFLFPYSETSEFSFVIFAKEGNKEIDDFGRFTFFLLPKQYQIDLFSKWF